MTVSLVEMNQLRDEAKKAMEHWDDEIIKFHERKRSEKEDRNRPIGPYANENSVQLANRMRRDSSQFTDSFGGCSSNYRY